MHLVSQLLLNQVSCVLINLPEAEREREESGRGSTLAS